MEPITTARQALLCRDRRSGTIAETLVERLRQDDTSKRVIGEQ